MKTNLLFGFAIGVAFILFTFAMNALGWDSSPFLRNLNSISIIFIAGGVYFGIKARIDDGDKEEITFQGRFLTGIAITLVATIIAGFFSYIFMAKLHPELTSQIIEKKFEMMRTMGLTEDKVQRYHKWMLKEFSPKGQMFFNSGAFLLLGTIFSAIFSFFLGDKKSEG